MLPAAFMPGGSGRASPENVEEGPGDCSEEVEEQLCPNCGTGVTASEVSQRLISEFTESLKKIQQRQQRLAKLKDEVAKSKLSCGDSVELKRKLAEQWNKVLLARSRVRLARKACDEVKKLTRKETEEVQLLDKTNRRRSERLKRVDGKNFPQKENAVHSEIIEDQKMATKKLDELVKVRQSFLASLYLKVFPIEVLPLSEEDEGAEDYYERTSIDCDRVFELEGGWVLGGVHQHPTPHISIVAPSLPASGDHTPYLTALLDRAKNKGVVPERSVHPFNDPYLSTPAALVFVAHFVEVIGWVLDQPLPFPLHRPVAISEYGNPEKRRRSFLAAMAKLDDNIMYLCFSQHVPLSALSPGHTLQNLLALVTHSQLGRTGAFECHPELTCYGGGLLLGGGRRRKMSARGSPLLLSHDIDDSQPPNVSYASTHSLSSNSEDEEEEREEEEEVGGADTPDPMVTSQHMDWEHLDPSIEELRLFEEEQMRQALLSSAKSSPPTSSEQNRAAYVHAQETEIYRQRLRRLDYNSTYMDYAALTSIGSGGGGASPGNSFRASSSVAEGSLEKIGKHKEGNPGGSPEPAAAEGSGIASGIFGTLSSLWTSTFGGSKS